MPATKSPEALMTATNATAVVSERLVAVPSLESTRRESAIEEKNHVGEGREELKCVSNVTQKLPPKCPQILCVGLGAETKKPRKFLPLRGFCLARTTGLEPAITGSTV